MISENEIYSACYSGKLYDTKFRFYAYWHQINCVIRLINAEPVLEVGIGNGFLSNYLQRNGLRITTFDINPQLKPNICGSVLALPFANDSFNTILCYEVLEHLPFSCFKKALGEMVRISSQHVILSLPDATQAYRFEFWIPFIGCFSGLLKFPWMSRSHISDVQHHWEIGKHGYPLNAVIKEIISVDLKLISTFRLFEYPLHRFFILQRKKL
jgi:SAM-dependent methyltransferase